MYLIWEFKLWNFKLSTLTTNQEHMDPTQISVSVITVHVATHAYLGLENVH